MSNLKSAKILGSIVIGFLSLFLPAFLQADELEVANLDIGFVTEAAVENGVVRVLIPTATDAANLGSATGLWNSGVPQANAFVYPVDATQVSITCPARVNGFVFQTPAAQIGTIYYDLNANRELTLSEAEAAAGNFVRYFGFLCPYAGTGAIGDQFATGSNQIKISGLINPALEADQTINQAVIIPGKIQLLSADYYAALPSGDVSDYLVSDRDVLISAMTQDVLITAKVTPQLTFLLNGVAEDTTACNATTTVASAPMQVDFGSPMMSTFAQAAHQLEILSSATSGYAITVTQSGNMIRNGTSDCSNDGLIDTATINRNCIPNFGWQDNLSATSSAVWSNTAQTGLGYTVAKVTGNGSVNNIFNNQQYTRFATISLQNPPTIASSTVATGAENDQYDVCYRFSLDAQNNAGVYTNNLVYTITATY